MSTRSAGRWSLPPHFLTPGRRRGSQHHVPLNDPVLAAIPNSRARAASGPAAPEPYLHGGR